MLVTLKKIVIVSVLAVCLVGCTEDTYSDIPTTSEEKHIEVLWESHRMAYGYLLKIKVDNQDICYQRSDDGGLWCREIKEGE